MAAHAFSALDSYIYGFAKQEKTLRFDTGEQAAAKAQILLARLPAAEYPYLHELMAMHVLQPVYSYADELGFGVNLVLDALEQARDAEDGDRIRTGQPSDLLSGPVEKGGIQAPAGE